MIPLGFHGEAGAGKGATAAAVRKVLGEERVREQGFADDLKVSAAAALGLKLSREDAIAWANEFKLNGKIITVTMCPVCEGRGSFPRFTRQVCDRCGGGKTLPTTITGRQYFENYGTEAHRDVFGADFWIANVLDQKLADCVQVIPDVRFENEVEAIHRAGGEVWLIERDQNLGLDAAGHVSRTPLPKGWMDFVIDNNGTLEHLENQVRNGLESFFGQDLLKLAA